MPHGAFASVDVRGDAHRSSQPSRLSAAAVSGGDGRAVARRHRLADPLDPPQAARVRVLLGDVERIDRGQRSRSVLGRRRRRCAYDYLIVAAGATHSYFGHDDWSQRRAGPQDARRCAGDSAAVAAGVRRGRARAESRVSAAAADVRVDRRRSDRRGIGRRARRDRAAGAAIGVRRRRSGDRAHHPDRGGPVDPAVVSRGPARLGPARAAAARHRRARRQGASPKVEDGAVLDRRRAHRGAHDPVGRGRCGGAARRAISGPRLDRAGRVIVEPDLSVPGHPGVFVAGDLASFSHQTGKPLPGVAQVAKQQGAHAAANVARADRRAADHAVSLPRSGQHGDHRPQRRRLPTSASCGSRATSAGCCGCSSTSCS